MRLLIVEDDDDIAVVIEETLRLEGYSTDRTADGVDGLWMAREGRYGLVVLDLLLPGKNGFEICKTLRDEGIDTLILMLTSKAGDYDETDGFDAGADDYLRKPFSPEVLGRRVQALLRRSDRRTLTPVLTRGSVVFTPSTRHCAFNGEDVQLTARESQLLEVLLRAGEVPVGRQDLLASVWGFEFTGSPNVVDVTISYLRAKLSRDAIENIRGLGFRVAS